MLTFFKRPLIELISTNFSHLLIKIDNFSKSDEHFSENYPQINVIEKQYFATNASFTFKFSVWTFSNEMIMKLKIEI
jgi:hypothetical protein